MDNPAPAARKERFLRIFPGLFSPKEWPPARLDPVLDSLSYRTIDAGVTILREGQVCGSVPFVMEGRIRIFKTAATGREITLYRIEAGQSCIVSAGCTAGNSAFPASVVAELATFAAFMPNAMFRRLHAENADFRDFILGQYSRRMAEVIELVEEVAFRRVDERLHQWLLESMSPSNLVTATHQELADHTGTSREVVSRILKDWEERRLVEIARGSIKILPGFSSIGE
jgi:CRP/FNR family transcriptional regulator